MLIHLKPRKGSIWPVKEYSFNVPLASQIGVNEAILLRQMVTSVLVCQNMRYGYHRAKKHDFKKLVDKSKLINTKSGYRVTLDLIHERLPWVSFHTCVNIINRLREDGFIYVAHNHSMINDYSNYYYINFNAVKKWLKYI